MKNNKFNKLNYVVILKLDSLIIYIKDDYIMYKILIIEYEKSYTIFMYSFIYL